MSIITIRKSMEKKGCQVVLVLIGVAMAVGMIMTGMSGNQGQKDPTEKVIFSVGPKKVTTKEFLARVETISKSQSATMAAGTPQAELASHMTAIQGFVNDSAIASLAKEKGLSISEANIASVAKSIATQYMEQTRGQLIMQGMIEPTASQEQADAKIKELSGKTPDQLIQEQTDEIVTNYGDLEKRAEVVSALLPAYVQESYKSTVKFTEEDLKAAYNDYNFSVIRFDDLNKTLDERQSAAVDALEKIKGGADFAAVQKEVNPDAKPEDKNITLSGGALEATPDLKELRSLKPGQTSDMILAGGSPTIYRFNSVSPNLPPEFETSKAMLLENGKASRARQDFDDAIKAKTDALEPKFEDQALQVGFEVYNSYGKPEYQLNPEKLTEFLKEKLSEMRSPEFHSDNFPGIAAATQFLVQETLYAQADDEAKKEMVDDRIEAANRMLEFYEDNGFRVTFARELLEQGRNDESLRFAQAAAAANADFEGLGQGVYAQISALISDAEGKKAWSAEAVADLQKELARWQSDQQRYIAEQKEFEEAQKKAQEELDKELANAGTTETPAPPKEGETPPKTGN